MPMTGIIESASRYTSQAVRYASKAVGRASNVLPFSRATVSSADRITLSNDIKEAKNVKDFVSRLIGSLAQQKGFKTYPQATYIDGLGPINIDACFLHHGEFAFDSNIKAKDIPKLANSVAHEMDHFERLSFVARLPGGIERLAEISAAEQQKTEESIKQFSQRWYMDDIYDLGSKIPGLGKLFTKTRAEELRTKMVSALKKLWAFDPEQHRAFWSKIVNEKGYLTPGTPEYKKAQEYLRAIEDYDGGLDDLKSLKAFIKNAFIGNSEYKNNIFEEEAMKAGNDFQRENGAELRGIRDRLMASNNTK